MTGLEVHYPGSVGAERRPRSAVKKTNRRLIENYC